MFPDLLQRGIRLRDRLHSHLKAVHEPDDCPWRPDLTTYKVLLLCSMICKQFGEEDEVHLRVTLDRALGKLLFKLNGGAQFQQRLESQSLGFQHSLLQQSLLFATALG
ncbi:hypothetical protein HJFPF1_13575 [Paramyrothecium foliicola]|nr:hypothetical protein HJFPF1_13575 [Paramyrothecium foliicola]